MPLIESATVDMKFMWYHGRARYKMKQIYVSTKAIRCGSAELDCLMTKKEKTILQYLTTLDLV